jgi:dodecin
MPDKTYKVIEVVGISDQSIQQAVRNAVKKAGETLRNLDWFEVREIRGAIDKKANPVFQVTVRIGFRLEGEQAA